MKMKTAILLAWLIVVALPATATAQQPVAKGHWSFDGGAPTGVDFDYGTLLTAADIEQLSGWVSLTRIGMGHAGVDSEYVTLEGDLLTLGRLRHLRELHLNKDGIVDSDLEFVASLPEIRSLEFNAKNGGAGCTDRCADHLRSAGSLRELRIHNGHFTDTFVARITLGLPDLEVLSLASPELTDESLRLLAVRCKKLNSLSLASEHFTPDGLEHLAGLPHLKGSVDSPALRDARRQRGAGHPVGAPGARGAGGKSSPTPDRAAPAGSPGAARRGVGGSPAGKIRGVPGADPSQRPVSRGR